MKIKLFQILTAALFLAVIFTVPILTKLEGNAAFSQFEYRELAKPPVLEGAGTLFDPAYYTQWETYFSDHVWQRETMMALYTRLNIGLRPVVNDVVIQDDLLLPFIQFGQPDNDDLRFHADRMAGKLAALNETVKSYGGSFTYLVVPEQFSFFRDRYPLYLNNHAERLGTIERFLSEELDERGVDTLMMRQVFDSDEYYSRTDHHFSYQGAYFTYLTLMEKLNAGNHRLPVPEDIAFIDLENPFYGSRNRKLYGLYPSEERLSYYVEASPLPIKRTDNGTRLDYPVFELPADAETPVTYAMYMGGDIGETVIETNRPELPSALIFGDSFTNPLETFLYHSFNETRSLDLRYYPEDFSVLAYIERYRPDYVFCMRDDISSLSVLGNGNIQ